MPDVFQCRHDRALSRWLPTRQRLASLRHAALTLSLPPSFSDTFPVLLPPFTLGGQSAFPVLRAPFTLAFFDPFPVLCPPFAVIGSVLLPPLTLVFLDTFPVRRPPFKLAFSVRRWVASRPIPARGAHFFDVLFRPFLLVSADFFSSAGVRTRLDGVVGRRKWRSTGSAVFHCPFLLTVTTAPPLTYINRLSRLSSTVQPVGCAHPGE